MLASFAVSAVLLFTGCSASRSDSGGSAKSASRAENQAVMHDSAAQLTVSEAPAAPVKIANQEAKASSSSAGNTSGAFSNPLVAARKMIYQA
ncbi:hypothetical protein MXD63_42920, partial [Frankia sp. Cpl3]|nr:hypothetical protein [Frankia sp. Cpl3]